MKKFCPDPPPVEKILNFFFLNEPFSLVDIITLEMVKLLVDNQNPQHKIHLIMTPCS